MSFNIYEFYKSEMNEFSDTSDLQNKTWSKFFDYILLEMIRFSSRLDISLALDTAVSKKL